MSRFFKFGTTAAGRSLHSEHLWVFSSDDGGVTTELSSKPDLKDPESDIGTKDGWMTTEAKAELVQIHSECGEELI